ncbi:MAG TPA: PAS domain S-box protein [Nocardioidaceae bacterium]|nr:PAS domain S-box protein [Nocardioidaceae bacterium]
MVDQPPSVVVVDDAVEVRLLVKTRLRLSGLLEVVGEGADGAEAVALAGKHQPSLMLLDVSMPDMDGLEALPHILAASPLTKVVLYSGFEEQGLVDRARDLGAAGFIEKSTPVESLVGRLLAALAPPGEASVPPGAEESGSAVEQAAVLDQAVLQEHLERFHEVFEEAAIGMSTMTLTGRLVRVNRALASLLRKPAADLVGVFYGDLTDGGSGEVSAALEDIRRRPLDVVHLEHRLAAATDSSLVRATLAPVRDSGGRALYLFLQVQDVTAERAAIEGLRQSEERLRMLVEAVEEYAIFMLDTAGHVVSWNTGAQRINGYTAEEIIGQHFRVFYPEEVQARKHPEYELGVALREGHYEEQGWRLRKDGSPFWANVLITAVFNDAGEHIGFAKVTRDNSGQRRIEEEREHAVKALATAYSELEALNGRLRESAQEQAQFLAVTAHELRTPIGVLAGSSDTLSQHWNELTEEEREDLLAAMASSAGRLRRLLADLLTVSRLQASALRMTVEAIPVARAVERAVTGIRRTWPDADVVADVPEDLMASGDPDRLGQALDNLLTNALRHGAPPVLVSARRASSLVEIRVTDHGPGVSPAIRPQLFERFATGRSQGGTGLGLFIVRELARAQGGDAFYEGGTPESPAGAFVFTLPAWSDPAEHKAVRAAAGNP